MPRNILLVEVNEITWDLIDPLIRDGKLPAFARLKKEGTYGAPVSIEAPRQLDPWVTWNTLYTGRPQADHNVFFLQQPPESITAPRLWEICHRHGLSVGVYGSLCSWPPQKVDGFYVPDTFAPDTATHPAELEPIQTLNLTYTRSVRLRSETDSARFKVGLARKLLGLGLSAAVVGRIASQLLRERIQPDSYWRRVSLQPAVNFDFFRGLYLRHRPRFATFHTNHVAHYQHTYWQAMEPEKFQPLETTEQERRSHGGAIELGYRTADQLLARMMNLLDGNTVMIVASSMGQKPYVSHLDGGKAIQQVRSHAKLLEIIGVRDVARAVSTMSDEFTVYCDSGEILESTRRALETAYVNAPERLLFHVATLDRALRVNLRVYSSREVKGSDRIHFPDASGAPQCGYEELIYNTGHLKSGCHDPRGVAMFYGPGIPRGVEMKQYNNLDFAPTMLEILGLPRAERMTGQLMEEVVAADQLIQVGR
jgi:Type I phosphodiesterase / nucleotide pyrophosphatase